MLIGLKKKIEAAKKLMGLCKEGNDLEYKDESRRIMNDFKHYLRRMWSVKHDKSDSSIRNIVNKQTEVHSSLLGY